MIHCINILTDTRSGDTYDKVSINKYPIIYIDDETVDNILDDEDLIKVVFSHIKNRSTYDHATLYIRTLEDNYDITETIYKLSEKIPWRQ